MVEKEECIGVGDDEDDHRSQHLPFRPNNRRHLIEEEECRTEYVQHCTEPVIDFYVFIKGRCETVPEEKCRTVSREVDVEAGGNSREDESGAPILPPPPPPPPHFPPLPRPRKKACRSMPVEECRVFTREVPAGKRCSRVPVEKCADVPVKTCRQERVPVEIKVPVKVCRHSGSSRPDGGPPPRENVRPKREHQFGLGEIRDQEGRGGAFRGGPAPGCRIELQEQPRLQCTRVNG